MQTDCGTSGNPAGKHGQSLMHKGEMSTCSGYRDARQIPHRHRTRARCFSGHIQRTRTDQTPSVIRQQLHTGSSALTEQHKDYRNGTRTTGTAHELQEQHTDHFVEPPGEESPRWQCVTADVQGLLVPRTPPELPAPKPPNTGSAEDKRPGQGRPASRTAAAPPASPPGAPCRSVPAARTLGRDA